VLPSFVRKGRKRKKRKRFEGRSKERSERKQALRMLIIS
jgi:hypothetical protein